MKRIESKDNPVFKMLTKIESSARERREAGKCLLDGIHLVKACLASGSHPELLVVKESSIAHPEIRGILDDQEAVLMSDALFDRISPVKTPTGLLALVAIPSAGKERPGECCLFLDGIQDPGNLGSILRSAAAAGANDAFLSEDCADAWSPKTLRAGMGAHFEIRIHVDADLPGIMKNFDGNMIALALDAENSLFDQDLRGKVGFVIGNEGSGISEAVLALVESRARIPMPGRMESLNAAQAASICLFERVRQLG